MTVMVDELQVWPGKKPRCFAAGSCHLTCDGNLDELHAIAEKLGMRREWFQRGRVPHYDLTPRKREVALGLGAKFVPAKEQARRRIAARKDTPVTKAKEYSRRHGWEERDSLTVAEARAILDAVPESKLIGVCKLNRGLPRSEGMRIFRACLEGKPDDEVLRSKISKNLQREFGKP